MSFSMKFRKRLLRRLVSSGGIDVGWKEGLALQPPLTEVIGEEDEDEEGSKEKGQEGDGEDGDPKG